MKYTKRPITIEALKWEGTFHSGVKIAEWVTDHGGEAELEVDSSDRVTAIKINTREGTMRATPGSYVIRGVEGEFYPCAGHIFESTYREAHDGPEELDALVNRAGEIAENSGWHEGLPNPAVEPQNHLMWINTKLMLVVSEIVEAIEELRGGRNAEEVYFTVPGSTKSYPTAEIAIADAFDDNVTPKPEGFPVELADALIRLFDLWWTLESAGWVMPNPTKLINDKLSMNEARGIRHGGKSF